MKFTNLQTTAAIYQRLCDGCGQPAARRLAIDGAGVRAVCDSEACAANVGQAMLEHLDGPLPDGTVPRFLPVQCPVRVVLEIPPG